MKNLYKKIIELIKKPSRLEQVTVMNYNQLQNTNDNLIAIARLSLIKPDVLVREARNVKSNAEYLVKMIEALKENEKE